MVSIHAVCSFLFDIPQDDIDYETANVNMQDAFFQHYKHFLARTDSNNYYTPGLFTWFIQLVSFGE